MKKTGLLNDRISLLVAEMGHLESLMICDAGMPIPRECNRIDLALTKGVPGFMETLETILQELEVEKVVLAEEIKEHNEELHEQLKKRFAHIPLIYIPHGQMKTSMKETKGVIRTGECSPYANILLISGVIF
ncbi:MAG: D-ribose pyranase [Spirochaetales bacterium]|nr:D-ribose pyranase [Spirochaetales bacterium]